QSDGTQAGTVSLSSAHSPADPFLLTSLNGQLFFYTLDRTLWKWDGGTFTPFRYDGGTSASCGVLLTPAAYLLFFLAPGDPPTCDLWAIDGGTAGATILKRNSELTYAAPVGTSLFFRDADTTVGAGLWKSDGSPTGTVLVKGITPGAGSSYPCCVTSLDG